MKCQDLFMTQNGWSNSLFGYWFFFGRPAAARKAIVENERLRRWLIIEFYSRAFAFAALGTLVWMGARGDEGVAKMSERISVLIIPAMALFWLLYLNYLLWFNPQKFQSYVDQWIQHHKRFRPVLNDSWYDLLTNETFFRVMVFVGLLICLSVFMLIAIDPLDR